MVWCVCVCVCVCEEYQTVLRFTCYGLAKIIVKILPIGRCWQLCFVGKDNIGKSSVPNLLHVTYLESKFLRGLLENCINCSPRWMNKLYLSCSVIHRTRIAQMWRFRGFFSTQLGQRVFIIYLFTAIGLLLGGSGYFTCKQNMKLVTNKFKLGGLHEKHVVATWDVGNHLSICF